MRKILISLLVIGIVSITSIKLSQAFFSDTETSTNNILAAGAIDLLVNNENNPTAIVNFQDLKPGDNYTENKTLRVIDNDAYVWMHIKDVETSQGSSTEPEDEEENGVPKFDINNYLEYALNIGGDEIFSPPVNFNDAVSCWIPLGQVTGGEQIAMNQTFSFDPTVTNWAQGDTMTFTEEFYAEQVRNNPSPTGPVSLTGRIWNGTTCEDCQTGQAWASQVINSSQGLRKNNTPITDPNRTNPDATLGASDWVNNGSTGFFSLGKNGVLTVEFASPIIEKSGTDFSIYEATNGRTTYPEEKALVEVSQDGSAYFSVGTASSLLASGVSNFDFSSTGLVSIKFIKLTDTTNYTPHANDADGFDVDAIGSQNVCVSQ